tara:strand:+ start:1425 stop:1673 length:249 start_codon:yes stop_codon:yes gene_type:complete
MNNYYVTETLEAAQAQESADFIETRDANPLAPAEYWLITTAWCTPIQRLDGKWIRKVCPDSTATGRTIETIDESWFSENLGI